MIKYLLVTLVLLTGCTREVMVEKTTTQYVGLDDSWLADCPLVPPPDELVYSKATLKQRVDMLTAVYLEQAKIQAQCRIRSEEARKYNALKRAEVSVLVCKEGQCK